MLKRSVLVFVFFVSVFLFFFFFFFYLHPISVSDTDDWFFLSFHRSAVPVWRSRNPIRVFAEISIPTVSSISSALFLQLTGNIFKSLSLGYAICLSGTMTLLAFILFRVFTREHSTLFSLFITFFFLLCHFWIFRTAHQDNDYMLRTADACTVFFYVIPNLLNCILVMWLELEPCFLKWDSEITNHAKAFFVVLVYFCVFSNIWAGMILAAYCGCKLLFSVQSLLCKKNLKTWFSDHIVLLAILALWLFSQIFEMNGGRANRLGKTIAEEIPKTLSVLLQTTGKINKNYLVVMSILFFGGLIVQLKGKNRFSLKIGFMWAVCFFLSGFYLILSCSKVAPSYATRPDVFYGLFFFGFMLVVVNGTSLIKKIPFSKPFLLLLLIIALNDCTSAGKTFRESNTLNLSPRIVNNINNDIVKQLKDAERMGLDSFVLEVPKFETQSNWPYSLTVNTAIGESMWKLGVIQKNILIDEIIPCEEKNTLLSVGEIEDHS